MKIGCAVWNVSPNKYYPPFEEGIEIIGELGFDGCELIISAREQIENYYTDDRIDKIKSLYSKYNMSISEFVIYAHMIEGLVSLDKKEKQIALRDFEEGVKIAKKLESKIVCTVSHWIPGLKAPACYPPLYIHPNIKGVNYFYPKLKFDFPHDMDWNVIWDNYVDSIRQCTKIAESYGIKFAIEGHPHVIVGTTDAFLRLFDQIDSEYLGVNYDTGHQYTQREYPPISFKKLGSKIFHIHARDTDGLISNNLPIGQGILDWEEIISVLKNIGYDGFLSLELGQYREAKKYNKESLDYLRNLLK